MSCINVFVVLKKIIYLTVNKYSVVNMLKYCYVVILLNFLYVFQMLKELVRESIHVFRVEKAIEEMRWCYFLRMTMTLKMNW